MLEAAAAADRLLAVNHFRRFFPVAGLIRDWIKLERLGKLTSFDSLKGGFTIGQRCPTPFST